MTEAGLERRLWFTLSCSDITWRKPTKRQYAMVVAQHGERHRITLPPDADDHYVVRTLLHELMHVTIHAELGAFGVFEEDILERVLEPRLMEYLLAHPRRHERWLAVIRKARGKR